MIDGLLEELTGVAGAPKALRDPSRARLRVVQVSSRWEGRNVWALFAGRARYPEVIVKVDQFDPYKRRLRREHEALVALTGRPELRGSVPRPIALVESGPTLALVQTGLAGQPLAVRVQHRLRPGPRPARREHGLVLSWLARLQREREEATHRPLLGEEVTGRVEGLLDGEHARFAEHVRELATRWDGLGLPRVPGHGDLGPSNCLVGGDGIAVIDWEGGVGHRSPLTDVVVFLNHYGRLHAPAGNRRARWTNAFRRVFLSDDWLAAVTAKSFLGHLERLGVPVAAGEYLFVVALVELASGEATVAQDGAVTRYWRPFLDIYAAEFEASRIARAIG